MCDAADAKPESAQVTITFVLSFCQHNETICFHFISHFTIQYKVLLLKIVWGGVGVVGRLTTGLCPAFTEAEIPKALEISSRGRWSPGESWMKCSKTFSPPLKRKIHP